MWALTARGLETLPHLPWSRTPPPLKGYPGQARHPNSSPTSPGLASMGLKMTWGPSPDLTVLENPGTKAVDPVQLGQSSGSCPPSIPAAPAASWPWGGTAQAQWQGRVVVGFM